MPLLLLAVIMVCFHWDGCFPPLGVVDVVMNYSCFFPPRYPDLAEIRASYPNVSRLLCVLMLAVVAFKIVARSLSLTIIVQRLARR